ncbi:MAG: D-glycerate dehydrogenase [Chloroflexi bacterium]|nr:D-glycerate dehydrogenase [Chloroflexota bacterium]
MPKPRVFVTRRILQEALDLLAPETDMKVWEGDFPTPHDVLTAEVREMDGVLTMLTERVDAALLDAAPRLRVVSNMAVGYDNIDVAAATRRGILVGNTPGVLTETTADFAFALLLAAARRAVEGERFVREGKWQTWHPTAFLGLDVHGATLGIVGLGNVGQEVARRALGFSMRVIYYDSVRRRDVEQRYSLEYCPDLPSLLRRSDLVTLHVPLTPQTHHLIGAGELALMKPHAILVNTARGLVVDPKALYEALHEGRIAGAALDVTEPEPIPPDDPLLTLPNVIVTPHIGSASVATRTRMAVLAAQNLLAGLKGQPMPHCVNPQAVKQGRG